MRSMTGFGVARADLPAGQLAVQVAAVNGRHLQVHVRSELRDLGLEELVRSAVRRRCVRGSVTVQVSLERGESPALDQAALKTAWQEMADLAKQLDAPVPRLELVARLQSRRGGGTPVEPAQLTDAVERAIDELDAMRRAEGTRLAEACTAVLADLRGIVDRLASTAAERLPSYRERLVTRVKEAVGDLGEADEAAVLRECALQADRLDIDEELVRLRSHCDQFAGHLAKTDDEPAGRTLEFLLQEMGREVNTSGSKANDADLAQLVVEAKGVLEKLREQAANIL